VKQTSALPPNGGALAKSAVYVQSFMLFLAELEVDEIEDDSKVLNFSTLQCHSPLIIAID